MYDSEGRPVKPREPKRVARMPVVSLAILGICILVFIGVNLLLTIIGKPQYLYLLTFSPANGLVFPGIISHMFAHADVWHLVFNMIMLYFLGIMVEMRYGGWRYALLFLVSGVFAALAQSAFNPGGLLLGASGALAGVLAAFVRHYPHVKLYIWGILPIPAWLAAVLWMAYNIIGAQQGGAGIAFVAHLAGFIAGAVISVLMFTPGRPGAGKPVQ